MMYETVQTQLLQLTGVSIDIKRLLEDELRFTYRDLQKISSLFFMWKNCIPETSLKTFLSTIVKDLALRNCCAISTNPASPCYIGRMARCIPNNSLKRTYSSYVIGEEISVKRDIA